MTADDPFLLAFDALPLGRFEGVLNGSRWIGAKTAYAGGRSFKLQAEEAGGDGYLSANIYRFADGRALLKPCEMAADPIHDFVLGIRIA